MDQPRLVAAIQQRLSLIRRLTIPRSLSMHPGPAVSESLHPHPFTVFGIPSQSRMLSSSVSSTPMISPTAAAAASSGSLLLTSQTSFVHRVIEHFTWICSSSSTSSANPERPVSSVHASSSVLNAPVHTSYHSFSAASTPLPTSHHVPSSSATPIIGLSSPVSVNFPRAKQRAERVEKWLLSCVHQCLPKLMANVPVEHSVRFSKLAFHGVFIRRFQLSLLPFVVFQIGLLPFLLEYVRLYSPSDRDMRGSCLAAVDIFWSQSLTKFQQIMERGALLCSSTDTQTETDADNGTQVPESAPVTPTPFVKSQTSATSAVEATKSASDSNSVSPTRTSLLRVNTEFTSSVSSLSSSSLSVAPVLLAPSQTSRQNSADDVDSDDDGPPPPLVSSALDDVNEDSKCFDANAAQRLVQEASVSSDVDEEATDTIAIQSDGSIEFHELALAWEAAGDYTQMMAIALLESSVWISFSNAYIYYINVFLQLCSQICFQYHVLSSDSKFWTAHCFPICFAFCRRYFSFALNVGYSSACFKPYPID